MNEAFKIGYRNLKQRKARTALTILAIALGISILVGVNIGSDMIQSSFEGTLDENLGYIDVVSNIWGYNGPSYQDVKNAFDRGNLQYLDSWVPRYVNYLSEICLENDTFFDYDERLDSFMIGLDTNSDMEKNFGRVKVISVHENFSQDLVGKYASPDLFLKQSNNITRPVVLTRRFLETNDIMENVSAGDVISIRNRYPHPDFPFSTWYSPATWPNFTVVAIVDDLGKLGTASLNPYSNYFIYLGLEDMWNFVFNEPNLEQPINYIMAHSTERAHVEELGTSIQDLMTDELGLYFSSSTPKQSWIKGMTPAFNIIRVAFSIFAAISLVVCGVLIKNLFETAKQTDIHEIGILKGIGFGQSFILKLYLTQIFIMASIGIALGLLIGLGFASAFVTFLTRSTLTTNILNITFELSIKVNVSVTTLMTGIGLGYAIPFGFGLIPVLQTARIEVINAIKSGRTTGAPSVKREVGKSLATLAGGIGLTIACTVSAITGITQLLDMKSISYQDFIAPTIAIFAGIVGFLMGMILIGIFALPVLSKVFTWAILLPMQRSLKQICYRTLMRNKRRTINTFMMMAIGLSFTVTITTITSSISAGIYPRSKTIIGGDIQLGSFLPSSYGLQTMNRTFISEIENLSLVDNACMYRHSIDPSRFYSWVYTTVGLAATRSVVPRQLDQYQEYLSMAGNKVDNYGYITGGSYNSYKEYLSVSIIDGKKYYDINNDAILKVPQTGGRTVEDVFTRLDTTASIILQSDLQGAIKKTVGQTIVLQIEGMSAELEIVGYADVLPGNPWTFGLEFLSGFSDINNPYAKDLSAVISWNTYNNITGNFFKNIDLIIKNRFWQEGVRMTDPLEAVAMSSNMSDDATFVTIKSLLDWPLVIKGRYFITRPRPTSSRKMCPCSSQMLIRSASQSIPKPASACSATTVLESKPRLAATGSESRGKNGALSSRESLMLTTVQPSSRRRGTTDSLPQPPPGSTTIFNGNGTWTVEVMKSFISEMYSPVTSMVSSDPGSVQGAT